MLQMRKTSLTSVKSGTRVQPVSGKLNLRLALGDALPLAGEAVGF